MNIMSIDIDWAPEQVIIDTLNIFEKEKIKCTIFCTHQSEAIQNCNKDLFEISIHPNFNPILFGNNNQHPSEVVQDLLDIYPKSKGVRSHSLVSSPILSDIFREKGLIYESNNLIPYSSSIRTTKLWNGIVSIPINWEDNIHYMYNYSFDNLHLDLDNSKLNVFNFHPIHIYLNTDCEETYERAKHVYQEPEKLNSYINNVRSGTKDLLVRILKRIKSTQKDSYFMSEVHELFL